MNAVVSRCAPLIERAAPSLMPAMDIANSSDRFTFWELWDPRQDDAPAVAKYATTLDGVFKGAAILPKGGVIELFGIPTLEEFLVELRRIEAGS